MLRIQPAMIEEQPQQNGQIIMKEEMEPNQLNVTSSEAFHCLDCWLTCLELRQAIESERKGTNQGRPMKG